MGFAAETHQVIKHAQDKLKAKQLDMIVANQVNLPDQGFNSDDNQVTVLTTEKQINYPLQRKHTLARTLIQLIADEYNHYKEKRE